MPIDYNEWKEFYIKGKSIDENLNQDEEPCKLTYIYLDEQTLINSLEGEPKQYVLDIAKEQEEKFGNIDIWSAKIYENLVEVWMGEIFMGVYFNKETHEVSNVIGALGSRYEDKLIQIAVQLHNQLLDA